MEDELQQADQADKEFKVEELIRRIDESFIRSKRRELHKFFIEAVEKSLIERVLEKTDGNQLKTALILGINRNTLRNKIKKFDINVKKWKIE